MAETAASASPTDSKPVSPELDAWIKLNMLVLSSASEGAVNCGGGALESLQQRVQESVATLNKNPGSSQVLIAAGALSQAFAHYHEQNRHYVEALHGELRTLVGSLVDHIAKTSQASEESLKTLSEVRSGVQPGGLTVEFPVLQQKLAECLENIRKEGEQRRAQAQELTNRLHDKVTILDQTASIAIPSTIPMAPQSGTLDPCTGLPMRTQAEIAIQQALASGNQIYVAAFYLHRMQLINARFGETIGNQIILFCSQHIATALTHRDDALFRWPGPAFVAVLNRDESHVTVHNEIQRLTSVPLSRFFETPSRTVYLPVKLAGEAIPASGSTYAEISDQIDQYILAASSGGTCPQK